MAKTCRHLNFDSSDPKVHLEEGQRLAAAGQYEEAEDALRRAVATGPIQPDTWLSLINFLVRRGKLAEAEAAVREAQIQLPEYLVPVVCGQGYELIGQREQALDFYTRAYNADPDNLLTLRTLAGFYINGARSDRALKETAYKLLDKIRSTAEVGAGGRFHQLGATPEGQVAGRGRQLRRLSAGARIARPGKWRYGLA